MSNEKIYTIRITEALNEKCGCPLCTVERKLESDETERILGAAMMEPDVRLKTNEQGFCRRHADALLAKPNKLSLALILQSHMAQLSKKLYSDSIPLLKKTPDPKKQLALLEKKRTSCYLCSRINEFMNATYSAFAYMYKSNDDFEQKLKDQPYLCLEHTRLLFLAAARELSKESYRSFCDTVNEINASYAAQLQSDIDWFCKKFDYRYKDDDWKNSKDSVERALKFLN